MEDVFENQESADLSGDLSGSDAVMAMNSIKSISDEEISPSDSLKEKEPVEASSSSPTDYDLSEFELNQILDAEPLEPCILYVGAKKRSSGEDPQVIGIPGYIHFESRDFFLLNGEPVKMEGFSKKFKVFLDEELSKRSK